MKTITVPAILCCIFLLVQGCKQEDAYVYPSVRTDFIDVQTDANGTACKLLADNGETYRIMPRQGIDGLTPDSLYRTVSIYSLPLTGDSVPEVQLYSSQAILSPIPIPPYLFTDGVKTDPVDIQSIWRSGQYLNLILLVAKKDKQHTYHFVDEGIHTDTDGKQTLRLRLYHNNNGDYPAFTSKVYLSVPLQSYQELLNKGDQIRFYINTSKEGNTWRDFTY